MQSSWKASWHFLCVIIQLKLYFSGFFKKCMYKVTFVEKTLKLLNS